MSKRELIDHICEINKTARAEFLATFSEEELQNYLEHLRQLRLEELTPVLSCLHLRFSKQVEAVGESKNVGQ
jgi:hypothetical protein